MTSGDGEPGFRQGDGGVADIDLAVRWLGGSVVAASDEAFGDKENLLRPEPASFEPGHYGNRGEIVDGWETRRRRRPGHDWAIVRLGAAGTITAVDVDTSFFTGNFPVTCRIEGSGREGHPGVDELTSPDADWHELVARTALRGDAHNLFSVGDPRRFTHVRLSIEPDGGVARFRVLGRVVPDPRLVDGVSVDVASADFGGRVIASSDGFYTSAASLIRPDSPRTMGEGWETRRRRDDGHDSVTIQLGAAGVVRQLIVDTTHFKYNASESVAIAGRRTSAPADDPAGWRMLHPRARLQPDTRHLFVLNEPSEPVSAVRLDAFPDGGIARLRVIASVPRDERRRLGLRWFNALPDAQARACLAGTGVDEATANAVLGARPVRDEWRDQVAGVGTSAGKGAALDAIARLIEGPA